MRIASGCDDTGFPLKEQVAAALEASGHDLLDLGTFSTNPVDHPDYARAGGQAVLRGFVDAGVLICSNGAGASIAANKIRGVRASLCHDPEAARLAREEDDANVLCLGAREVDVARAVEIASAWLAASFSGEERFVRKVSKVALLEGGLAPPEKGTTRQPAPSQHERPPAAEDKGKPAAARAAAPGKRDTWEEVPVEAIARALQEAPADAPPGAGHGGDDRDGGAGGRAGEGAGAPRGRGLQAAGRPGDHGRPRGPGLYGPSLGQGRVPVEGRDRGDPQSSRMADLADHHARPRRRHQKVRGRDPEASVHARRAAGHGGIVALRRRLQPDLRLQDGLPRPPAARLDRSRGDQADARPAQPHAHALHRRHEVRHHDRDPVPVPVLPRTGRGLLGAARRYPLRRLHRPRPAARQARNRVGLPPHLPQPGLDRQTLLGPVLLRPRAHDELGQEAGRSVAGAPGLSGAGRAGDYIAIQAYLAPTADTWSRLQELRTLLRDRLKLATTVAFGPRYLHSTGQLHKGGRPNGVFIQITGEDKEDMAIPGAGYGFSTLKTAQALGDLQALWDAGRRVVRVHLTGKQTHGVEQLIQVLQKAIKKK